MNIECPHCSTSNSIEFAEHIICCKCSKSFKGQSFRKLKKPMISAGSAMIIGLIGGYKIDHLLDANRYPVGVEYAIVDSCVNSSAQSLSISRYQDKRAVCLCATEATISQVPYSDFKESQMSFSEPFKIAIAACNRGS